MKNDARNDNTNTNDVGTVRPLAASQARELTPTEIAGVAGGWPSADTYGDRCPVR